MNLFYLFGEDFTIGNIPKILSMCEFTVINFVLDSLRLISGMLMYEKSSVTGMALLFGRDIEPKKHIIRFECIHICGFTVSNTHMF